MFARFLADFDPIPPEATRPLKEYPIEKLTAGYGGKYDAEFLRAIDKALVVNESKRPQNNRQMEGISAS
jgi:hypothetical protein